MANVSANTNSARRCAVVENVKVHSPEPVQRKSYGRGRFNLVNKRLKRELCVSITASPPPRRLKRLGRIDIEKRAKALDRNLGHRFAVPRDQMTGADIAVERHQFVEEAARPQHRIAASVF